MNRAPFGIDARAIRRALQIAVGVSAGQDIERTSRRDLENRCDGKVGQEAMQGASKNCAMHPANVNAPLKTNR